MKNYVKNELSIYPEIKETKDGKTKLQSIFDFLLSEKNNSGEKKWPKYIEDSIKHNKDIKKNIKDIKILDNETLLKRKKKRKK